MGAVNADAGPTGTEQEYGHPTGLRQNHGHISMNCLTIRNEFKKMYKDKVTHTSLSLS